MSTIRKILIKNLSFKPFPPDINLLLRARLNKTVVKEIIFGKRLAALVQIQSNQTYEHAY